MELGYPTFSTGCWSIPFGWIDRMLSPTYNRPLFPIYKWAIALGAFAPQPVIRDAGMQVATKGFRIRSANPRSISAPMIAILSLLFVIMLSILITRVATVALTHTGLSKESARFQARSAFTGVGFTTTESEKVVGHPVRRRILLLLMLLGNAGIVTAMSSLILTFVGQGNTTSLPLKVVLLVAGVVALYGLASSHWVDHRLSKVISWALERYTSLDVKDYASLLRLTGDYRVSELRVEKDDWLAERTLTELALRDEGIVVLGIRREDGTYLGAPRGSTRVLPQDTMIVYGRISVLDQLDQRRKGFRGDVEHEEAVVEHEEILDQEEAADEESKAEPGSS